MQAIVLATIENEKIITNVTALRINALGINNQVAKKDGYMNKTMGPKERRKKFLQEKPKRQSD